MCVFRASYIYYADNATVFTNCCTHFNENSKTIILLYYFTTSIKKKKNTLFTYAVETNIFLFRVQIHFIFKFIGKFVFFKFLLNFLLYIIIIAVIMTDYENNRK